MKNPLINTVCVSLLIILLTYTGTDKLLQQEAFKKLLTQVPLLAPAAGPVSLLLPLLELVIALLLFFPASRPAACYASLVLLSLFTVYLTYMVLFLPHLPCSCGGVISGMGWKTHIFFNLIFIGIAWAAIKSGKPEKPAPVLAAP